MDKFEDLIITINNKMILDKTSIAKIIDYTKQQGLIPIYSISIRHNLLNFYESYKFDRPSSFKYGKILFIEFTEDNINVFICIERNLHDMVIRHDIIGSRAIYIHVSDKFCVLKDTNLHMDSKIVFIGNNNRLEAYKYEDFTKYTSVTDKCGDDGDDGDKYNNLDKYYRDKSITDEIANIKADMQLIKQGFIEKSYRYECITESQKNHKHQKSCNTHERICTNLIHKLNEYSLADYNIINYITDYLCTYRY